MCTWCGIDTLTLTPMLRPEERVQVMGMGMGMGPAFVRRVPVLVPVLGLAAVADVPDSNPEAKLSCVTSDAPTGG